MLLSLVNSFLDLSKYVIIFFPIFASGVLVFLSVFHFHLKIQFFCHFGQNYWVNTQFSPDNDKNPVNINLEIVFHHLMLAVEIATTL